MRRQRQMNKRDRGVTKPPRAHHRQLGRGGGEPAGRRIPYPGRRHGQGNDDVHEVPDFAAGVDGHAGPGQPGAAVGSPAAGLISRPSPPRGASGKAPLFIFLVSQVGRESVDGGGWLGLLTGLSILEALDCVTEGHYACAEGLGQR